MHAGGDDARRELGERLETTKSPPTWWAFFVVKYSLRFDPFPESFTRRVALSLGVFAFLASTAKHPFTECRFDSDAEWRPALEELFG